MYGWEAINDEVVPFGFEDASDWLKSIILSFPAPWSIAPLDGNYYGTNVLDGRGITIWSCWSQGNHKPSKRQASPFKGDIDRLREYCCDGHYETQAAFDNAHAFVSLRNEYEFGGANADKSNWENDHSELIRLFLLGRWEEPIWSDISCGGPNKRSLVSSRP